MIVTKVKPMEVNKIKEATTGVDGSMETAAAEIEAYHVTGAGITFDAIPGAAVALFTLELPRFKLRAAQRRAGGRAADYEGLLELQEGRALTIVAE
uniref:Uncharacterized protein n=1 Tax=Rhizophora mucronata TaxID=61149 RepID=A0A2P2Q8L3_RHIMU